MVTITHPPPLAASVAAPPARRAARHRGTTLPELLVALVVSGLLAALALGAAARTVDQARARTAAEEVRQALGLARRVAVLRGERTAVRFDSARGRVTVHVRGDTVLARALADGVRLAATRESTAYGGDGLGYGAANLRVLVRRGAAAETVVVSRLGRVR